MKNKLLLLASLFLLGIHANATIVWTNLIPHQTTLANGSGATFDVDLDNNATIDYRFTLIYITGSSGSAGFVIAQAGQVGTSNFVSIDTVGGVLDARAFASGNSIDSSSIVWHSMASSNPNLLSSLSGFTSGYWTGNSDWYLGVKFLIGSNYHYGWIKMSINPNTMDVTLKEYAYENVANTAILAGAKGPSSVNNLTDVAAIKVKNNTLNNTITFSCSNTYDQITTMNIVDMQGRIVKMLKPNDISSGEIVLNTQNLSSGIYMYTLKINDMHFSTGKLFIE